MSAIRSCPDCPLHSQAPNLAELARMRELHRQLVRTGTVNAGNGKGSR